MSKSYVNHSQQKQPQVRGKGKLIPLEGKTLHTSLHFNLVSGLVWLGHSDLLWFLLFTGEGGLFNHRLKGEHIRERGSIQSPFWGREH